MQAHRLLPLLVVFRTREISTDMCQHFTVRVHCILLDSSGARVCKESVHEMSEKKDSVVKVVEITPNPCTKEIGAKDK